MLTQSEYEHYRKLINEEQAWWESRDNKPYEIGERPEKFHEVSNHIRSQVEFYEWMTNPPEEYMAYVKETPLKQIITWTGEHILGDYYVIFENWQSVEITYLDADENEYTDYETQRVKQINVHGTNGKIYSGTYFFQDGDYCHLWLEGDLTEDLQESDE